MKRTVIITARMRDEYAELVSKGEKRFEVRDESFQEAQAIHYVSAQDGHDLGTYLIEEAFPVERGDEARLRAYAGIPDEEFDSIFPLPSDGGSPTLWVARIGGRTTISTLIGDMR